MTSLDKVTLRIWDDFVLEHEDKAWSFQVDGQKMWMCDVVEEILLPRLRVYSGYDRDTIIPGVELQYDELFVVVVASGIASIFQG